MGNMQQAVLEFDEAVVAPWRPRLRPEEVVHRPRLRALPPPTPSRAPAPRAPRPVHREARPARREEEARPARREPLRRPPAARAATGPGPRRVAGRPVRTVARPGCAPASSGRLRLTARGRVLVTALAVTAATVLAAVVGAAVEGDGGLRLAGESAVVVQPGDTVWDIAASVSHGEDVRAVVDEIQRLNGLDGAPLVPGQTLQLP